MTGYLFIEKLRRLESDLDRLGLVMAPAVSHLDHWSNTTKNYDTVAVKVKGSESLPIYTRDALIFSGSIEDTAMWVQGVMWARGYDRMVFGDTIDTKRERKEQDYRNKTLVQLIKNEKVEKVK
jgi:hypothetical protein